GGVGGEPGGEVVGPVEDEVAALQQPSGGVGGQPLGSRLDLDVRVQGGQPGLAGLDLEAAEVVFRKGDLALQIGQGDAVIVDQAQAADPGRRQIEGCRGADAAHAEDGHAGDLQPLLARAADLCQHQVARVALDLVVGKA